MSGFFAALPDAWAIAAESLRGAWPDVCAATDLRWWVDQIGGGRVRELPTERQLCERWGWGNRRVRTLLHDVGRWADPLRLDASRAALAVATARAPAHERSSSAAAAQQQRSSATPANADNLDSAQQQRSSSAAGPQHSRAILRAGSPSTGSHHEGGDACAREDRPEESTCPKVVASCPQVTPGSDATSSRPAAPSSPPPTAAPAASSSSAAPSARPATPGTPSTASPATTEPEPVHVAGHELPADLPALLGFARADFARVLVVAGIENTRHMLELTAEERRVTPGVGPARWRRIAETLADRWPGVELGCLAPLQAPPETRGTGPPLRARSSYAQAIDEMYGSEGRIQ